MPTSLNVSPTTRLNKMTRNYVLEGDRVVVTRDTAYNTRLEKRAIKAGTYGELVSFKVLFRADPYEVLVRLEEDDAMVFISIKCLELAQTQ